MKDVNELIEDRIVNLEQQINALQIDHDRHAVALHLMGDNVQSILTQLNIIAASLAAHTTTEATHHATRMKLIAKIGVGIGGIVGLLTAIHSAVTGLPVTASVIPMLKSLIGI